MAESINQSHFVLVHGLAHGAWCWYKVKPALELAGHRVTAVDLASSGVNMTRIEEVRTLRDYSKPLLEVLESIRTDEKVVIVGHSMGGLVLALAADEFPTKISVAVFLTAFMPDTTSPPGDTLFGSMTTETWLDTEFETYGDHERPLVSAKLGPKYLETSLYQLSPPEDLELAKMLVRAGPAISSHLAGENSFNVDGYGSVARVFIVCTEDQVITEAYQRRMIKNFPVKEAMEIQGADHMAMFSKPQQVCDLLLEVSKKYA